MREGSTHPAGVIDVLRAAPLSTVTELPRPAGSGFRPGTPEDVGLAQRVALMVAAYHEGVAGAGPVVCGWLRTSSDADLQVVVGGRTLISAPDEGGQVAVAYPAAARGRRLRHEELERDLGGFAHWVQVEVDLEPLAGRGGDEGEDVVRPNLEDGLLAFWREPFVWLVVASPRRPSDISARRQRVARDHRAMQSRAPMSIEFAVEAERLDSLYREFRRGEVEGLWDVTLLAGAATQEAAHRVAGLLCASSDVGSLPYVLRPPGTTTTGGADAPREYAGVARSELLARLARPPLREVRGVRFVLQPDFDVTPESEAGRIVLGHVLDRSRTPGGTLSVTRETLNRHTFVCGATGAGKSQTVRHLLEQLAGADLPWLVVEPAKAEYRRMARRLGPGADVIVIRPGDITAPPAGINPLEPEPGFPLQTHIDLVRALFLASFDADEPFPQVLAASLTRCYEELGWDLVLGVPRIDGDTPCYPTLSDLQRVARRVVTEVGYGPEVMQNVRGFMDVRLASLRHGTPGRFFEGGHPLHMGELLRRRVVLEIEDVGSDQDKAFLMGMLLIRLVEYLRVEERMHRDALVPGLRHVTVFEEAHRLLRRVEGGGPAAHAVELFAGLLAEIRAYGEGIVVAEQIPARLLHDVIKNTALKVVHRLPALDDREPVGATMNLTPAQSEYVVTLRPGEAACHADGMDYPLLVQMPNGAPRESGDPDVRAPTDVIGRASRFCPASCQARACTMTEIRQAERLLDRPDLTVWVELVTIAHVVGPVAPYPGPELREWAAAADDRLIECAVSHAARRAATSRGPALARHYSPLALAERVTGVVLAQREDRPLPWEEDGWRWQAGPYRWYAPRQALRTAVARGRGASPHPLTGMWARRYGRVLVGATCEEQLATEGEWRRAERGWTGMLLFGADQPSALEVAVGVRRDDPDWAERLQIALRALRFQSRWALPTLAPPRA